MSANKVIYYILIILRYALLITGIVLMLSAALFAVFCFFVPRNYDWYLLVTSNIFLKELYLGDFRDFLKFDAIVFFSGLFSYFLSVILSRLSFSYRSER